MNAALFGYVLGTLQVLLLEWFRRRTEHQKQLRTLRAELRRLRSFETTFDISDDGLRMFQSDSVPNVPTINPRFHELVMEVDFKLTDEHDEDNSQEGLLNVSAGCELLRYHAKKVVERLDRWKRSNDPHERQELRDDMLALADFYNENHAVQLFSIGSALDDIERRLAEAAFSRQVRRQFAKLPPGTNPPPMGPGDERLRPGDVPPNVT